jgi:hypothetical protein
MQSFLGKEWNISENLVPPGLLPGKMTLASRKRLSSTLLFYGRVGTPP